MNRAATYREKEMTDGNFVAVSRPSRAEGVGRALQAAFRDGFHLPDEIKTYLDRLEGVRY